MNLNNINNFDVADCVAYPCMQQNLYEMLIDTAKRFPDKVGIIENEKEYTFSQILAMTKKKAKFLRENLSVQKGSRVGCMLYNGIAFVTTFYGVIMAGCTFVSVNTKLKGPEVAHILTDSNVDTFFINDMWYEKIKDDIENCNLRYFVKDIKGKTDSEHCRYFDEIEALTDDFTPEIVSADDDALIIYTSGTTGKPKGALLSNNAIMQNVLAYKNLLSLDEHEIMVMSVPIFHITGLSCLMALFIHIGGLQILPNFWGAEESIELMRKHKATHIHAVATIFIMLYRAGRGGETIDSLRTAACGGGYITEEDIENFCTLAPNLSFSTAYGMSETAGAAVLYPTGESREGKKGASGLVMPNTDIKIVDNEGNILPTGEVGEVAIGGPVVCKGYLNFEEGFGKMGGYLLSGDLGYFDEDGYLYISGRKKEMIIRGGEKIYPYEVEKLLLELPGVASVAVYGVDNDLYGEEVAVAFEITEEFKMTAEDVTLYLSDKLAKYKIPKEYRFLSEMPRTATGKIQKKMLRDMHNNGI